MKTKKYGINSISDAFLALNDILDEEIKVNNLKERSKLKEAASVDLNNIDQVEKAQEFRKTDEKSEDNELEVIDVDADSLNELKDSGSYIGKILLQCNSCKATKFVDVDKLQQNENDPELYNTEDECPHCHNTGTGYALIGQVGKKTDEPTLDNDTNNGEEAMFDNTNDIEPQAEETPTEETSNDEDTEETTGETSYDETNASDDTDELNLPELGDEFDVDDVMEDDTEEKSDDEDQKKVKKESLNEDANQNAKAKYNKILSLLDKANIEYDEDDDPDQVFDDECIALVKIDGEDALGLFKAKINGKTVYDVYAGEELLPVGKKSAEEVFNIITNKTYESLNEDAETYNVIGTNAEGSEVVFTGTKEECEDYIDTAEAEEDDLYGDSSDRYEYTIELNTFNDDGEDEETFEPFVHHVKEQVIERLAKERVKTGNERVHSLQDLQDLINEYENNLDPHEDFMLPEDKKISIDDLKLYRDWVNKYKYYKADPAAGRAAGQWYEGLDEKLDMATFEGSIANLIDTFTIEDNPVNIKLLNKNGSELGMYGSDDLPFNVKSQMMDTFNTDDNYLEVNVTENGDGTTVNDLFNYYRPDDDNQTTFVVTNVDTDEEEDFDDLTEFLEKYGDYYIDGALGLRTLNIYIADGDLETEVEPLDDEEIEELGKENAEKEETEVTEESLIEEIINSYPGLKLNRINNALSEEYFIADSIRLNEDIELVYKNFVKPTNNEKLIEHFKSYTGYEDEIDKFLKEHNISKDKYNKIINEDTKISKDIENTETKEKEDHLTEKLLLSVKDRAELGEAINKLVEAKEKYRIAKSLTEGYRYDIFVNEDFNEGLFDSDEVEVLDDGDAEAVDTELVDQTTTTDIEEPVETTDIVPDDMRPEDIEMVEKIDRIATDIISAIQEAYGVDVSDKKNLIVADIIQDLQLIGGEKVVDDLENTPINELTKQMYQEFNGFYDAMDELVSFFTGEEITTSQADRLAQAIKSLDSKAFSTDVIYQQIDSPRFLQAAESGAIPYIDPALLQAPTDESLRTFDEDYNTEDRLAELKKIQKERKLTDDEAEELAYCENEVDSRHAEQNYLNGIKEEIELNDDNTSDEDCEQRLGELLYLQDQRELTDEEKEELEYCRQRVVNKLDELDLNKKNESNEINLEDFDNCINEYLENNEDDLLAYRSSNIEKVDEQLIINGLLEGNNGNKEIQFTLTKVLNEDKNETNKYIVKNNLNDSEFNLEM